MQNAAVPSWLAIALAVLAAVGPVTALFGVLWTQRRADIRAQEEAKRQDSRAALDAGRRLAQQRESERFDKLFAVCEELLRTADALRMSVAYDGHGDYAVTSVDFYAAKLRAEMVAPGEVISAAARHLYVVMREWAQTSDGQVSDDSLMRMNLVFTDLRHAVRESIGATGEVDDSYDKFEEELRSGRLSTMTGSQCDKLDEPE